MSDFSIDELIQAALNSTEPDPHRIADTLMDGGHIPQDWWRELARRYIAYRIRALNRHRRSPSPEMTAAVHPEGASRWARHASEVNRLYVPHLDEWKLFEQLDAEDCDSIAEAYVKRSKQNAAQALRFKKLAVTLRRTGVATVGDLAAHAAGQELTAA